MPRIAATIGTIALAGLAACATGGGARPLQTSTAVPAASGRVEVERQGPNTSLDIQVRNLAPPSRVEPGANAWVVWARPLGAVGPEAANLGALPLREDLSGRLRTLTPMRAFELFVTAEPAPDARTPTGPQVLRTQVSG